MFNLIILRVSHQSVCYMAGCMPILGTIPIIKILTISVLQQAASAIRHYSGHTLFRALVSYQLTLSCRNYIIQSVSCLLFDSDIDQPDDPLCCIGQRIIY